MYSRVPLPTDNIYKFYALFGLLVILTTSVLFVVRLEHYNNGAYERYIPLETLKHKKTAGNINNVEKLRLDILQSQSEIEKKNRDLELGIYIFSFLVFGILPCVSGFAFWHRNIQPKQDELLDLQIEKLKKEISSTPNFKRTNRPAGKD